MTTNIRNYIVPNLNEEPWFTVERQFYTDVINKLPSNDTSHVGTEHLHSALTQPNNNTVIVSVGTDSTVSMPLQSPGMLVVDAGHRLITQPVTGTMDATYVTYTNAVHPELPNVALALNYLLRVAPSISMFIGGSNNEKGETITAVTVIWTLSGDTPTHATLTDVPFVNISDGSYAFTGLSLTTDKVYTLTVGDDFANPTSSASTTVHFTQALRYGNSANASLSSADILALPDSFLTDTRQHVLSMDGNGYYLYIAYPATYGHADIWVMGLEDTSWIENTVSYTNASGYTENYYTYRSAYVQMGTGISVEVK